jgi:hypothetical protein
MPCCQIGCQCDDDHELSSPRKIAIRTIQNTLLHIEIQWCSRHIPKCAFDCILKECKSEDLLRAYGH